jgi:hypothetical protein
MCPATHNPGSHIIRAAEMHCELCAIYGQNISEETVRQWQRTFKDGQTNNHNEEQSVQPSAVNDDLVQGVGQNICERQRFKILELSCEFLQISCNVLFFTN